MSSKTKTRETPICDRCGKTFKTKQYLQTHQRRKTLCDRKFPCKKCGRRFPTPSKLRAHERRKTPCVPEEIPIVTNANEENKCHICGKTYSSASNLRRHQRICDRETNMAYMMKMLIEQNKKQGEREQKLLEIIEKNGLVPISISNTTNNNNTTINNVQQNMYVNVTLCVFGNEDLSRLDSAKVMDLLKNHADDFMPKMIEHVHSNPEMPEYHNVFYDPQKEKAIVFTKISDSERSWSIRDIKDVSEALAGKIKEHIKPGSGPYFDMAAKAKDYDTSNSIIRIVNEVNWMDDEVIDKNKGVLTKVKNNTGFSELVDVIE